MDHKQMTADDMKSAEGIMAAACAVIKEHSKKHDLELREFRAAFFDGQIKMSPEDSAKIYAVKSIELDVIQSFVKSVSKLAKSWVKRIDPTIYAFDELVSEGMIGLLNAMYGYDGTVAFHTFAYSVVTNHYKNLRTVTNKVHRDAYDLLNKFFVAEKESCGGTFAEVVETMGLSPKEVAVIEQSHSKVHHESTLSRRSKDGKSYFNQIPSKQESDPGDRDLYEQLMASVQLSELEQDVLTSYLYGGRGWSSNVANRHINSRTGKHYTRANIYLILERLLARLKKNAAQLVAA